MADDVKVAPEGKSSTDLGDVADAVETLRLARAEKAKWEAVEEAAREKIEEAMGDAEEGFVDGHKVITWYRTTGQTRVDVKRLRAEIPAETLAPYLVKSPDGRQFKPVD